MFFIVTDVKKSQKVAGCDRPLRHVPAVRMELTQLDAVR